MEKEGQSKNFSRLKTEKQHQNFLKLYRISEKLQNNCNLPVNMPFSYIHTGADLGFSRMRGGGGGVGAWIFKNSKVLKTFFQIDPKKFPELSESTIETHYNQLFRAADKFLKKQAKKGLFWKLLSKKSRFWFIYVCIYICTGADLGGGGGERTPFFRNLTPCRPKGSTLCTFLRYQFLVTPQKISEGAFGTNI